MQTKSHRHLACFAIAIAAAALAGRGSEARAGTIEGTVAFPSRNVPAMTVYASDLETSRLHTVPLARGQTSFAVEVPAGRYVVFLAPNEPGAPDVYGAYTHYSGCAPDDPAPRCQDHSLVPLSISGKTPHAAVTIDDWYLSDEVASQIDRILDAAAGGARFASEPLSAPRFSEYPSESFERAAPPKIDFTGSGLSEEDRDRVQSALGTGPNFAGNLTVAVTSCGPACGRVVLIDWRSGAVQEWAPDAGDEPPRTLPCRAEEALLFRPDSRLLSVTRVHGASIVTQYYVWNPKGAPTRAGEYQRSSQAFCAVAAG